MLKFDIFVKNIKVEEGKTSIIKRALNNLIQYYPALGKLISEGFYTVNIKAQMEVDRLTAAIKMYLDANNIDIAPRKLQLLVQLVKYDTSTKSRNRISKQIKMSGGSINQNFMHLHSAGLIVYPYEDSKKSKVIPELQKIGEWVMKGKKNIMIRLND